MNGPAWLAELVTATRTTSVTDLTRVPGPPPGAREAAVLVLLAGTSAEDADVLLLERATTLRSHGGQVAFPGGAVDPGDDGPVGAALREAEEETGLDPSGVEPLVVLPELHVPPSGYRVRPVLAHWREPSPVRVVDPAESATVARVPLGSLMDPRNRFRVRHPSGYTGPAFSVDGLLVWGFTGGLLATLTRLGGWERPWDTADVRDLAESVARARAAVAR